MASPSSFTNLPNIPAAVGLFAMITAPEVPRSRRFTGLSFPGKPSRSASRLAAEVHQVPFVHFRGPVHRESGRLVEDDDPLVLVEDVELRLPAGQERPGLAALLQCHGIAEAEERIAGRRGAVHGQVADFTSLCR